MSPEQQTLIDEFIEQVVADKSIWPIEADRRAVLSALWYIKGYRLMEDGTPVPIGKEVKISYGALMAGDPYREQRDEYERKQRENQKD